MKKIIDDVHLMVKVCDLYYNQNISQQEISKSLNLSRPTVSRLLSSAREQGIVQISISNLNDIQYWEWERKLEKRYGLKAVLIVEDPDEEKELEVALGRGASRYLESMVKDNYVVGVSAGGTIAQIAASLSGTFAKKVTFVPLTGGIEGTPMEYQANSIAEQLSRIYEGRFIPLFAPAKVSKKTWREELLKESGLYKLFCLGERMDMAVIEIEGLRAQFYDSKRKYSPYQRNEYAIGMDIQKMKNIPYVIGIAGGIQKLSAIREALAGQYINTLVTDIQCASALLDE